jgi:epoxyqueuosine reductase QueG
MGALPETGFLRERCLSFLSQKKGALSAEAAVAMRQSGIAWGCDLCQEACVCNLRSHAAPLPELTCGVMPRIKIDPVPPDRAYTWRGEAVLRRNLLALTQ